MNYLEYVVFGEGKRTSNFTIADCLVAEKQLPIPGLHNGYTATDVKNGGVTQGTVSLESEAPISITEFLKKSAT